MAIKIKEIINHLESIAPKNYQESYDNSGLITGNPDWDIKGALLCLDSVEEIIEEAIQKKCNLIIAHHPIVFSGLKSITGKNYIERTIIKAIKHDIAIYAIHTNLDNIRNGVNFKIAQRLTLKDTRILAPKKNLLKKLYTYVPNNNLPEVQEALFDAGGGMLGNYSECSFYISGKGTFKGNELSNPTLGEKGKRHAEEEFKLEIIFPAHLESKILTALRTSHVYEEIAYEIVLLDNANQDVGSGLIGTLDTPMEENDFLKFLKEKMNTQCIRHTKLLNKPISKVALCGGAGSFLLNAALHQEADIFITGDYKYHQFFDAENKIVIADIGHYESEQYTIELFYDLLNEKFGTFALHLTEFCTNPINYF